MSNACRNSLLIIVAVIVCIATPLLGSTVFAQSEMRFPVIREISASAPNLDAIFADVPVNPISVSKPKTIVNTIVETQTGVPVAGYSEETTFMVRSELRFPTTRTVSHRAPILDDVFSEYAPVSETSAQSESYSHNTISEQERARLQKELAVIKQQLIMLQQQLAEAKEMTVSTFGFGSCGNHVKNFQKFLNRNGFTLASYGAGSAGQETSFFGYRTLAALKKFQSVHVVPVTGVVDEQTRDLINTIEYDVIGEVTAKDCVIANKTAGKSIHNSRMNMSDEEPVYGNFLTRFFGKVLDFFRNLFIWS